MRTGPRALALAAVALAFAGPPLRADRFEDSLKLAKANAATPAGREFEQRIAELFDEKKLRDALVTCAESAREEDVSPFMVLLELGPDGRASQVLLRPPVPVAVCLRWTIRETVFPRAPGPGYWVSVDVNPRGAPGVPPIPTPGVATATVPPTRTPAAPPPPVAAAAPTSPSPSPTATPSRPAPTPTPPLAASRLAPTATPRAAVSGEDAVRMLESVPASGIHVDARRPDLAALRRMLAETRAQAIGPILAQTDGVAPDDARLEAYWSLGEELGLPVVIALGPEPLGGDDPKFRLAFGDPLKLETVLARHPKLRIVVSGAAWPFGDAMVALMWRYPRVWVDTAVIAWSLPRTELDDYLKRLVRARCGDRILFAPVGGTARRVAEAVDAIRSSQALSPDEKRAILQDNAVRLLGGP